MFDSNARWIWSATGSRQFNDFACFRRVVELNGPAAEAGLNITADSRYELYVNGTWVGHGPARSWLTPWPVDQYDLRGLLRPGRNVLAVLVQHIGTSTFQYLAAQEGLVAQLEWTDAKGTHRLVTDESWRAVPHESFPWPVQRISCQQAWEEQFDARRAPGAPVDWRGEAFAGDEAWPAARVVRPVGEPPHETFEARDIPMLTREPVEPMAVLAVETVRPAPYTWSLNLRRLINTEDLTANGIWGRVLAVTHIHSPVAQAIQLHQPHHGGPCKLNGKELKFDDHKLQKTDNGVAHARLKKGWNTLMCHPHDWMHHKAMVLNIWTDKPIRFAAYPGEAQAAPAAWLGMGPFGPWVGVGPFGDPGELRKPEPGYGASVRPLEYKPEATKERFEKIWQAGALSEDDFRAPFTAPLANDLVVPVDVFAVCTSDRVVARPAPRVENPSALQRDNADWTTIQPPGEGLGVRLLLDFGREVIGYHEFEIDAPDGAILDDHNFEFIQRDGRFNLAEGMNNSFRYTCREGVQRYRTFVRRGFRYSWITLRNFNRPVRVRFVRLIMSTYPVAGQGDFACSDSMLQRIWHVGAHSVRCCSEDTYTDCPSYEQTHWVGDARNEALVDLVTSGDPRLSRHCWIQVGRSLDRTPVTESHVPSGWRNVLPAWTFLWMRWAQEHYQLTGDKPLAKEMIGFLDRTARGIARHTNEQGLFVIHAWNMFDWAPMDTPADGIVTHQNCLAVLGLRQAAQLARQVGQAGKARQWDKQADGLAAAVNRLLWSDKKKAYYDCIRANGDYSPIFSQQTQTAAYISGVAAGPRAARCRAIIKKAPAGFVRAGSPFYMFFVLEGLVREGQYRELVDRIRSYWGQQIDAGATTFWEMFYEDQERQTRSHCHGWSAAPTFFLSHHVLGVQPLEPGYAKVRIAPQPGGLAWAQGRVPTPHGVIGCRWSRKGRQFSLEVKLPARMAMEIDLPVTGKVTIEEGKAGKVAGPKGAIRLKSNSELLRLTVATGR